MVNKEILHKSLSSRWLRNGIHNLLRRADVRGSADIVCDAYRDFTGMVGLKHFTKKVARRIFNTNGECYSA